MPRLSRLSNPTGLVDIEKQRVSIVLDDQGTRASYSLTRLDLSGLDLAGDCSAVVVARRGNAELRTIHGPVSDWEKGYVDLTDLGTDGTWSFRLLLVQGASPKLVASAENIRPTGLGDSDSLIGLEPAELGQVPWELLVLEQDGRAVIRFNRDLYQSTAAAEADKHFACLVLPEAVRQLARWHVQYPGRLSDAHWEPFKSWLAMHGVTDEPDDDTSQDEGDEWCKSVVAAFCDRFRGVEALAKNIGWGDEE